MKKLPLPFAISGVTIALGLLVFTLGGNVVSNAETAPEKTKTMQAATDKLAMSEKYSKPSQEKIRSMLSELQYEVTQEEGTEHPFKNEYWDNHAAGIYVDIVSGEPLFSSTDKFDSGTGWPSFTKPIEADVLTRREDKKLWMTRVEVRSKIANSHLGHVFDDGPAPTGLRYCINSASLKFIPKDKLEQDGYGEFLKMFEK